MNKLIKTLAAVLLIILMLPAFSHAAELTLPDELPEEIVAEPPSRIVITEYSVGDGGLKAGEASTALFTLKNMNDSFNVNSILITAWVDSAAPVEFIGTNQSYIALLTPGGEAKAVFVYYTKNVDISAIGSVSAGFSIQYFDESDGKERTNNISVRLPVVNYTDTTLDEAYMQWQTPSESAVDEMLYSMRMQAIYVAGLVFSCICIAVLLLFKFTVLRRKP